MDSYVSIYKFHIHIYTHFQITIRHVNHIYVYQLCNHLKYFNPGCDVGYLILFTVSYILVMPYQEKQ